MLRPVDAIVEVDEATGDFDVADRKARRFVIVLLRLRPQTLDDVVEVEALRFESNDVRSQPVDLDARRSPARNRSTEEIEAFTVACCTVSSGAGSPGRPSTIRPRTVTRSV